MRSDILRQQMAENFGKHMTIAGYAISIGFNLFDISRPQQDSNQHSKSLTNVKLSSANDRGKSFVALNMMHSSRY